MRGDDREKGPPRAFVGPGANNKDGAPDDVTINCDVIIIIIVIIAIKLKAEELKKHKAGVLMTSL